MTDTERRLAELLDDATPEPPERIVLQRLADRARGRPATVHRRWTTPLLAAVAVGAVVAGGLVVAGSLRSGDLSGPTTTRSPAAPTPTGPARTPTGPAPTPTEQQLAKARALLTRWERGVGDAVYIPMPPPNGLGATHLTGDYETQQLGSWGDVMGKVRPYAMGLDQRRIVPGVKLPTAPPAAGRIVWTDGTTRPTEVQSAQAAFERFRAGGFRCGNCPPDGTFDGVTPKPVTLTAATATTMRVTTTRGRATVPAWRFSFAETTVQMVQAAVAAPRVSSAPRTLAVSMAIREASTHADGRTLTVGLIGAGGPSTQRCGADYFAYAVESAHAVGIVVLARGHGSPGGSEICTMRGHHRTATVRLESPLAGRSVLEMSGGTAVPVTR